MNPVLILTHNCLQLTKRCVASVLAQDIPTDIWLIDNGSTDGTWDWVCGNYGEEPLPVGMLRWTENRGVSAGWNEGLKMWFEQENADHVLVLNNDTVIPSWFYSTLLSYGGPLITGVSVGSLEDIADPPPRKELAPCPDFSAWLMRRECWDKVGMFETAMVHYASDLDFHIRAHRAGVRLMNAGTPFFHERSSTLRLARDSERREIEIQANMDRAELKAKWGCNAWDNSYAAMFDEQYFGIDAK